LVSRFKTKYHYKYKSDIPKDKNKTHELSKLYIKKILNKHRFDTFKDDKEAKLEVFWRLGSEDMHRFNAFFDGLSEALRYGHYNYLYDILGRRRIDRNLTEYLIIEVDGGIHNKQWKKNRDKTAEKWITYLIEDIYFIRIDKDSIILYMNKNDDDKMTELINEKIKEKYGLKKNLL